jgi:hypothetical protein
MTTEHPIALPSELFEEWIRLPVSTKQLLETAVQWGADMELEACCEWLDYNCPSVGAHHLRSDRRPNPPSLKQQALEELRTIEMTDLVITDTIRRALEALPDD